MEMVFPQEVQVMITMAIAGIMIMNLIYLSLTIPIKLILKFRMSFASVIASLCMTWTLKIILFAPILLIIPQEALENRWVSGLFMMLMLCAYTGWLYLFEPDSLHQVTLKSLKKAALLKNTYLLDHHKKEWLVASRNKDAKRIEELDIEIAKIRDERKAIKHNFSRFKWVCRLFKRKEITEAETGQ